MEPLTRIFQVTLDRSRKIQKFAFDSFAICRASPDQIRTADALRKANPMANRSIAITIKPQPRPAPLAARPAAGDQPMNLPLPPATAAAAVGAAVANTGPQPIVLLKIHLYSTLEVKQTTTLPVSGNALMQDVFDQICRKRKYDPKAYVLRMADTRTDVPLELTLASIGATEFCVLKRDRGGAGDIFLRPPGEIASEVLLEQPRFISDEITSVYKQYSVTQKNLVGRYERTLTIDGEHIHILAPEQKMFEMLKTGSYHISAIVSCKQVKKHSPHFKLVVKKSGSSSNSNTTFDFEASGPQDAADICTRVLFMSNIYNHPSNAGN
ncbi:hypothetical protein DFJ73DRAFT_142525 [Zopfochytrium polystomum]|nr:hypothetical protein DFJ73DRAFT_142525 [Zopfochytrium polystomum]